MLANFRHILQPGDSHKEKRAIFGTQFVRMYGNGGGKVWIASPPPHKVDFTWARIVVQVTVYRRLRIGRDGHLDQSEAYDIS